MIETIVPESATLCRVRVYMDLLRLDSMVSREKSGEEKGKQPRTDPEMIRGHFISIV